LQNLRAAGDRTLRDVRTRTGDSRNHACFVVARNVRLPSAMSTTRIDFISNYCDSWCDRCAFTQRCSAFAARTAIAMCGGDVEAGLELALGAPPSAEPDGELPAEQDLEEFDREYDERNARVDASPITPAAHAYAILAHRWLVETVESFERVRDPVVHDALDVIAWDHILIGAKLHRALHGRDEYQHGERCGHEHPIQNDWNGSAKVALVSIERSEAAWRVVASCTPGDTPAMMADHLAQLLAEVEQAFPHARQFVRPGFDEGQLV
jgi:hypothetical protein